MLAARRIGVLVAGGLVLGASAIAVTSSQAFNSGCDRGVTTLRESSKFTPYELRRSTLPEAVLPDSLPSQSRALDALPSDAAKALPKHQLDMITSSGVYSYFGASPTNGKTVNQFIREQGVQLQREPVVAGQDWVGDLADRLGERAVGVRIADSDGIVVWADPDAEGTRSHNVYWSDGMFNYSLIVDYGGPEALNLARKIACSAGD